MENTPSHLHVSQTEISVAAIERYARAMFVRKILDPHPPKMRAPNGSNSPVCHDHHILPKSLFPQFATKKWNIVRLSLEEHFDAHVDLAKMMQEQIAVHRALYVMTKRYPVTDPDFDWTQAAIAERKTNAAASVLQSYLRHKDWQRPAFRKKISKAFSLRNKKSWKDPTYRREQTAAIQKGRKEKFFADPAAVARATAAQSSKTSAEKHWRFRPVNIYSHETAELLAERVCLSDYCKHHNLNQGHMQGTLSADRSLPSRTGNRTHSKGYFARALDESGAVIGEVCAAVPPVDHHHARRADVFRASDHVCVARNVIIRQFCAHNDLGISFSQSALSRTAHADRSKPSSCSNPKHHKGYFARYTDAEQKE